MTNALIGTDIEYLVIKNGVYRPAGVVDCNGVKGKPIEIGTGGVEIDGCALELTMPPCTKAEEFAVNLFKHMDNTEQTYGIELVPASHYVFPERVMDVRFANTLGCSYDINVYTGKRQFGKALPAAPTLRTFGGHLHLECKQENIVNVVKWMDVLVGVYTVMHFDEVLRRKMYGKAGSFRPKPYGVEYRVCSSLWSIKKEHTINVFNLAKRAQELQNEQCPYEVRQIINSGQRHSAQTFWESTCKQLVA